MWRCNMIEFAAVERRGRLISGKTGEDEAALSWTIASVATPSTAALPVMHAGVVRHFGSDVGLE